ncbi:MAG TPA: DUF3618 domain-containing protein [Polyangiaceae bacterium]|nr:DUF3618 domain-containing protein [Polyangiaceae bacterium]
MTEHEDLKRGDSEVDSDPEVIQLQAGIEHTRADMSATIAALEARLSPTEVRDKVGTELKHVEERVRSVMREQMGEAKAAVQAELVEAKDLLRSEMNEAEEKIKRGLSDARAAVKQDVKEAISGAQQAVRAATLGQVEKLATDIGDKMNETRDTLVDTVRSNPVPAALVGVGLVWLLMNRSKSSQQRNGGGAGAVNSTNRGRPLLEQAKHLAEGAESAVTGATRQISDATSAGFHQAVDAVGSAIHGASDATVGLAHGASDAASHLADQAGHAASSVAEGAKQGVKRVEDGLRTQLHDNPMALGAAALAIGAVVGFSLPRTQREDALMGDTRDRLLNQAGNAAHEAASSAGQLAERALESVKNSGDAATSAQ